MNQAEFLDRLAQGHIPSVLFFEGPEEHLKQEALLALRKALLPEGLEDLNETRLAAPETDGIIAAAETLPFMSDRRLVLLRDHPAVVGRAEADDHLLTYLPSVPPTAVLLFYCVLPVRQKKIRNAVQKLGGLVEFKPLDGPALTSFVTRSFHDLGRECDARTADYLIFTCGKDTGLLLTEIAKISALHPDSPRVDPEDIRALATPTTESKVFGLLDALIAGQSERVFILLRNLLLNGEQRTVILYMLLRQYRLMQQIKIMQYEKKSSRQIGETLGFGSYTLQQYLKQASACSGSQVKKAVALCLETDFGIKSGELREEGALEALLLKLLLLRKEQK